VDGWIDVYESCVRPHSSVLEWGYDSEREGETAAHSYL
jgi:hypothetical protein